jgi:hypothetical protein
LLLTIRFATVCASICAKQNHPGYRGVARAIEQKRT